MPTVFIYLFITITTMIKCWIDRIKIFRIQMILYNPQCFTKSLEMHNLTLTEEAEGVKNIGVVRKVNKIFVGRTRLLLCCGAVWSKIPVYTNRHLPFAVFSPCLNFINKYVHKKSVRSKIHLVSLDSCTPDSLFSPFFIRQN